MNRTVLGALLAMCALGSCKKDPSNESPAEQPAESAEAPAEVAKTPAEIDETPAGADGPAALTVPARDYLSPAWATFMHRLPGGKPMGAEAAAAERAQARQLSEAGHALYRKKKDAEAVAKYEAALEHWASGEIYYRYGNSLSNIDRLEDSIQAYDIALRLGPTRPELALYNTACAYSRLGKAEPAYEYLARAIDRGYSAFRFIEKDPDMAFLRGQPDYRARIEALIPKDATYDRERLVGHVDLYAPRLEERYTLCPDGRAFVEHPFSWSDDSCCPTRLEGLWKLAEGDLIIEWQTMCAAEGRGNHGPVNAICAEYDSCTEKKCGPMPDQYEDGKMVLAYRDQVNALLQRGNPDNPEEGDITHTPFAGGLPAACR